MLNRFASENRIASEFELPFSRKQNQDTEAQTTYSAAALERTVLNLDEKFDSRRSWEHHAQNIFMSI